MTLAERMELTGNRWYLPGVLVTGAFALGVQLSLLFQAIGAQPYPPPGKGILAWASLAVLAALIALNTPDPRPWLLEAQDRFQAYRERRRAQREQAKAAAAEPEEPKVHTNGDGTPHANPPVAPASQRLKVRVHSPLMVGPVVAPGEAVPIQVQAEPEDLAREIEVTFEVDHGGQARSSHANMTGTDLIHTETFDSPGRFTIDIQVTHPQADPATKRIEGRVATYREEVGRLFDDLKETAMDAGLDVGPQSTPREVCKGLPAMSNASYDDASALRTHLEVALYGDDAVDRATYEAIHTILRDVGLASQEEVPQ